MSALIDEQRERFGVQPICDVLGVSASAFYHRASGQRSARALEDQRLLELIRVVHKQNYEAYGYRRLWKELLRRGHTGVPRCQVQRLMAEHGIRGAKRRGRPWRTTICDPEALERPDLVNRDFSATQPGELLVADFTYVRCWQGMVFAAPARPPGEPPRRQPALTPETTREHCDAWPSLATGTVAQHTLLRGPVEPGQYTSSELAAVLTEHDVLASVGTTGDAYDNAMAESFVDTFKTELIADRVWRTQTQLELAIVVWVGWYNNSRLHSALGDIPPLEHEAAWRASKTAILATS